MLDVENGIRKRVNHVGFMHLNVHPKFRRLGIATAMMKAAIAWAKKNPVIEKITLEVFGTNRPAIRLYEKMGFRREGKKVKEIKLEDGRYVDVILMARFVKGRRERKK
jgi:RimJ/RimL family protein N-acetyltransferase